MSDQTHKNESDSMTGQVKTAMDKVQRETGSLVDALVREGEKLRDQTLKKAEEKTGEIRERVDEVRDRVGEVRDQAASTLDNLEQLFEERVARALKRLGVPVRDDLRAIAKQLEEMNNCIQAIVNDRKAVVMTAHAEEEKDDLKMINGIGPALEGKLNAAGYCTYRRIASLTDTDIDGLETGVIHLSGRIRRDDWIGQARVLHARKYGGEAL